MEIELSDISGLPETLKTAVQESDGKHMLDLSKLMPAEDLTGLKSALLKERENVGAYAKLGKPDEILAKMAALEEKAAKGGKGGEEAQAKLDAMQEQYEGKLRESSDRLSKVLKDRAMSDLKAELAKVGIVPEGLDMMATFATSRVSFNDDGTIKVLSKEGKPMIGSGADHGATLSDLAKELAESMPYLRKDDGKGGGGKPPESGGKPSAKTVTRAQFDAMSPVERVTHAKSGGKVTD